MALVLLSLTTPIEESKDDDALLLLISTSLFCQFLEDASRRRSGTSVATLDTAKTCSSGPFGERTIFPLCA